MASGLRESSWPSRAIECSEQQGATFANSIPDRGGERFRGKAPADQEHAPIADVCEIVNPMRGHDDAGSSRATLQQFLRQPAARVRIEPFPGLIEKPAPDGRMRKARLETDASGCAPGPGPQGWC